MQSCSVFVVYNAHTRYTRWCPYTRYGLLAHTWCIYGCVLYMYEVALIFSLLFGYLFDNAKLCTTLYTYTTERYSIPYVYVIYEARYIGILGRGVCVCKARKSPFVRIN